MTKLTYATIDLQALQHNLERVRTLAPRSKVLAMIKANAYGHGIRKVAKTLRKADAFGVARLDEALILRDIGIKQPIVLMEGFLREDELPIIMKEQLDVVVHSDFQVKALKACEVKKPISVWLKVDTGMHRLGLEPENIKAAFSALKHKYLIRFMTHFSDADNMQKDKTEKQIAGFHDLLTEFPKEKSLANSAGILGWPTSHADWVRPGLMLYGVSPFDNKIGGDHDLKPVMSLYATLIAVKQVKKGESVGYNSLFTCPEDMLVGVVSIGYGDGYTRCFREGTPMLLDGKEISLIGQVSMDMITVDLRSQPNAKVGDRVTLWGEGLPIEQVAKHTEMIPYELLCGVTFRVPFITKE